jgi:hypothetical protein
MIVSTIASTSDRVSEESGGGTMFRARSIRAAG